jgi:hypothetical protein
MDELRAAIARKKAELDRLRGHAPGSLVDREHAHDFELTYTSNAIEGNTLSAAETMLVIEQGITIGGKPLKDHLEALDHFDALRFVRILASENSPLNEADIRNLHRLVVQRSNPEIDRTLRRPRPLCGHRHRPPRVSLAGGSAGADGRFRALARCRAGDAGNGVYGASPARRPPSPQRRQRTHGTAADEPRAAARRLSAGGGAPGGSSGL